MDPILIGAAVLTAAFSIDGAARRGADDPNWELRWRGLDPAYRDWLAAMTTSDAWMKTLSDPEEIQLARGFSRRERRRLAHLDLTGAVLLGFGVALVLAGILPNPAFTLSLLALTLAHTLADVQRKRQIKGRLPEPTDPDVVPTR